MKHLSMTSATKSWLSPIDYLFKNEMTHKYCEILLFSYSSSWLKIFFILYGFDSLCFLHGDVDEYKFVLKCWRRWKRKRKNKDLFVPRKSISQSFRQPRCFFCSLLFMKIKRNVSFFFILDHKSVLCLRFQHSITCQTKSLYPSLNI